MHDNSQEWGMEQVKQAQVRQDIDTERHKRAAKTRWENGNIDIANKNKCLQAMADKIWEKHPGWKKSEVARKLAKDVQGKYNTIRQIITMRSKNE